MISPQKIDILEEMNKRCPKWNRRVTFITRTVECEVCLNWCHKNYGGFSDEDY